MHVYKLSYQTRLNVQKNLVDSVLIQCIRNKFAVNASLSAIGGLAAGTAYYLLNGSSYKKILRNNLLRKKMDNYDILSHKRYIVLPI